MRSNSTSPCPNCGRPKSAHAKQCRRCYHPVREPIDNRDGTYTVHLTRGAVAIIDADDLPLVRGKSWSLSTGKDRPPYASRHEDGRTVYLHRLIAGAREGDFVDHWDRDSLNCRRGNLRIATPQGNMANVAKRSTGSNPYKGVTMRCDGKKWVARIQFNQRSIHLGSFITAEEAARAYDAKASELFGEFAGLNFPDEPGQAA